MSDPLTPKFKVGDRVRPYLAPPAARSGEVTAVYLQYTVVWEGVMSQPMAYGEAWLELAPPESPKPKWTTQRAWTGGRHEWVIYRGDEKLGVLRDEHLAVDLCARQNAQEQAL